MFCWHKCHGESVQRGQDEDSSNEPKGNELMELAARITLFIAGLIALYVGAGLLFFPVAFEASSGISLGSDPALLSEVRAPGGVLLLAGLFMWLGSFRARFTETAIMSASALYLAYGLSRIVGFALDGSPGATLVAVTALELIVGGTLLAFAFATRRARLS